MNAATTTAPIKAHDLTTIADQQSSLIRYKLRIIHTSIQTIEQQADRFSTFELETSALKLSSDFRALARVTADQNLILTIADIQDELQEILPVQAPSREKLLLSLSIIRSMIAELI